MMETVDKVNLSLSSLSIIMTIVLALVGYYWFVPSLREYQLRGRLEVSGKTPSPSPSPTIGWITPETLKLSTPKYEIDVHNVGALPAKDIQIVVRYSLILFDRNNPTVTVNPPIPIEANGDYTQILLKRSIAPDAHVKVGFSEIPVTIWVLTESGEANLVQAGGPEIIMTPWVKELSDIATNFPVGPTRSNRKSKEDHKRKVQK